MGYDGVCSKNMKVHTPKQAQTIRSRLKPYGKDKYIDSLTGTIYSNRQRQNLKAQSEGYRSHAAKLKGQDSLFDHLIGAARRNRDRLQLSDEYIRKEWEAIIREGKDVSPNGRLAKLLIDLGFRHPSD